MNLCGPVMLNYAGDAGDTCNTGDLVICLLLIQLITGLWEKVQVSCRPVDN